MRDNILYFISFLFLSGSLIAQPDTTWTKTFGGTQNDRAFALGQTADGGFIAAGYTASFGAGFEDLWLIRTDGNGDTVWTKTYGGDQYDRGVSVQETSDNGFIISGYSNSGVPYTNMWLLKTDSNGDTSWVKMFGGGYYDYGSAVQETADGGFVICGATGSYSVGEYDVWLVKTDSSGNTSWTKTYGDSAMDYGNAVQQTEDGGYIIAGYTKSYGAGNADFWLIRTTSAGDTLWTKTYGGINDDMAQSVQQTEDGGFIITGLTESFGAGDQDLWLIKTDASGDTLWTRTHGGTNRDFGYQVQQTAEGGYIVAGITRSFGLYGSMDLWLVKTNSEGDTVWTKVMGGQNEDRGTCVQPLPDHGYIVAGWTYSYGNGFSDLWLIRLEFDPTKINGELKTRPVSSFYLGNNYPNPFNPVTTITFELPVSAHVKFTIYNSLGQKMTTLFDQIMNRGRHEVIWDAANYASGTYFYEIRAGEYRSLKKCVLLK